MNPPLPTPEALARTYHSHSYADPWNAVEDYNRVMEYQGRHPNKGSCAVANALDLPRSRVRPWLDGSKPDPVRAIQIADRHGWLRLDYHDQQFQALNRLVAWVYSGGSIAEESWVPQFSLDGPSDREQLTTHFGVLGVEWTTVHDDEESRATELRPAEHASVLGRVLSVIGAPVSGKGPATDLSLPAYLDGAPTDVRQAFADVYLQNRAVEHADKRTLTINEERSAAFRRELAALLRELSGESVTAAEKYVTISSAARTALASKGMRAV